MLSRFVVVAAALLLAAPISLAQAVKSGSCGKDGYAHLAFADGKTKTARPQPQQVGCEDISVASDGHTVGWSVLVENCCTSYPIATAVVIYKDRKTVVISPEQMVWKWHFVEEGAAVAVLSGPVHGQAAIARLYSCRTGKETASWSGTGEAPKWADDWKSEFEP
jgi:hypothetical protein